MQKVLTFILITLLVPACCNKSLKYIGLRDDLIETGKDSILKDKIIYHFVRVDEDGKILPWYSANLGRSY